MRLGDGTLVGREEIKAASFGGDRRGRWGGERYYRIATHDMFRYGPMRGEVFAPLMQFLRLESFEAIETGRYDSGVDALEYLEYVFHYTTDVPEYPEIPQWRWQTQTDTMTMGDGRVFDDTRAPCDIPKTYDMKYLLYTASLLTSNLSLYTPLKILAAANKLNSAVWHGFPVGSVLFDDGNDASARDGAGNEQQSVELAFKIRGDGLTWNHVMRPALKQRSAGSPIYDKFTHRPVYVVGGTGTDGLPEWATTTPKLYPTSVNFATAFPGV